MTYPQAPQDSAQERAAQQAAEHAQMMEMYGDEDTSEVVVLEKQQLREPLTWAAIKHWAWNGDHAQAFITDRIAQTTSRRSET